METIQGKMSLGMDLAEVRARLANHNRILLDLGTGDGKFAFVHARAFPRDFVIGLDACRENLRRYSRANLQNLLYVIAGAQNLPQELAGQITHTAINFPWGSLLESLLAGDPKLMAGLASIAQPAASMEVRLNSGALAEAGWTLEDGVERIRKNLICAGWRAATPARLDSHGLRTFPSTWAKRLAFGRDPRAVQLSARK